jgi:hypothetical protein
MVVFATESDAQASFLPLAAQGIFGRCLRLFDLGGWCSAEVLLTKHHGNYSLFAPKLCVQQGSAFWLTWSVHSASFSSP